MYAVVQGSMHNMVIVSLHLIPQALPGIKTGRSSDTRFSRPTNVSSITGGKQPTGTDISTPTMLTLYPNGMEVPIGEWCHSVCVEFLSFLFTAFFAFDRAATVKMVGRGMH